MVEFEAITIDLDDIDMNKFNQAARSSPYHSREDFVYAAIHSLLEKYEDHAGKQVEYRYPSYSWLSHSIRYC